MSVVPTSTIRVLDSSRSAQLRGKKGEVLSVGRQVEVRFPELEEDPKGPVRRLNRNEVELVAQGSVDEESQAAGSPTDPSGNATQQAPAAEGRSRLWDQFGPRPPREKSISFSEGDQVSVGQNARTSLMRGQKATVLLFNGRQVEVRMEGGEVKKFNPNELVAEGGSGAAEGAHDGASAPVEEAAKAERPDGAAKKGGRARRPRRGGAGRRGEQPVYDFAEGAQVQVSETCRSRSLAGAKGTVVSFNGRQVELQMEGGEVRKLNPNELVLGEGAESKPTPSALPTEVVSESSS